MIERYNVIELRLVVLIVMTSINNKYNTIQLQHHTLHTVIETVISVEKMAHGTCVIN